VSSQLCADAVACPATPIGRYATMTENEIKLDRYAKFRALGQFREYVVKGGDWRRTGEERDAVRMGVGVCARM